MGRKRTRSGVVAASASSIQISFMYRGRQCRERLPLEPSPANLKRAEQFKASVELAIYNGTFDYAVTFPNSKYARTVGYSTGQIPLEKYLWSWLERKESLLKSSTIEGYSKIIKGVLIPKLGHIPIMLLSRKDIRTALETIDASNKRLSNIQSCLRSALHEALMDELIESNPMHGWTYARKEALKDDDDIDPFSSEEQRLMIEAANHPQYANFLQFALWTGLRTSELVAICWGDIDWQRNEIKISRAKTSAASEAEAPKTVSGNRDVRILAPAMEALLRQKQFTYIAGQQIFHDPRYDKPYTGDQVLRKSFWMPTIRKAKVRYRNPYQTRHTYASMMLSAGEHPMWVAKQMGHKDWTMIARVYGRWIPADGDMSGEKAVEMFSGKSNVAEKLLKPKAI